MKIWLLQIGEIIPFDDKTIKMRSALLAKELADRNHEVLWWTSAFDHFRKTWIFKKDSEYKIEDKIIVKPIKGIGYKKNVSFRRFLDHRLIAWHFKKAAERMKRPDLIVTSLPPHDLAYYSVLYANENRVPVIVDVRDQWPDIIISSIPGLIKRGARVALWRDFKMVDKVMKNVDSIVCTTEYLMRWSLACAKRAIRDTDKIFYLGCEKHRHYENDVNYIEKLLGKVIDKPFIVVFIGTFGIHNDPRILIECAKVMQSENVLFILAGSGELDYEMRKMKKDVSNVLMPGWLEKDEISALLSCANVGVCPTSVVREDAFHNKAFMYLSAGLPIISAFGGELKKIIEETKCGLYYQPGKVDELACCIRKLINNQFLYSEMRENAFKVFHEKFEAKRIYREYADHIERIVYEKGSKI